MSTMKVMLLRNVLQERNLSMKLYADRLAAALDSRCDVRDVRPWGPRLGATGAGRFATKLLEYLARYVAYPARIRHERADVYHIVDHAYAHLLGVLPLRRTVVTCHDLMLLKLARRELPYRGGRPKVATALLAFSTRMLPGAAVVVVPSRATGEDVVRLRRVPPERVRVVPHGVDPFFVPPPEPDVRAVARARFGLGTRPVLLHVGSRWFYKNIEGVLTAFACLSGPSPAQAPLLVRVGEPLTTGQLALARSLGVHDRLLEFGRVSSETLRQLYWAADVLVFPSLWEGFGWPVLEAMACGTPVVCSARGGLAEVVGDAGLLVDPSDPGAIAEGVRAVLQDRRLRAELAARGLERARAFTWERVGAALYDIYLSVAGGSA